jgi:hypothetical protein
MKGIGWLILILAAVAGVGVWLWQKSKGASAATIVTSKGEATGGTSIDSTSTTTFTSPDVVTPSEAYVPATKATLLTSTAFEIANSGLGGTAPVGGTITVKGSNGTQELINTGGGYAVVNKDLAIALTAPILPESVIINAGYATQTQLNNMTTEEYRVYAAIILANNPSLGGIAAPISDSRIATIFKDNAATGLAKSLTDKTYVAAIDEAIAQGVDLSAPVTGGEVNILTNTSTVVGAAAVVTPVTLTAQQANTYNATIAAGYTPFQAATLATSWSSDMTSAQITAAQEAALASFQGRL